MATAKSKALKKVGENRPIHIVGQGHGLAKTAKSEHTKHYDQKSKKWVD